MAPPNCSMEHQLYIGEKRIFLVLATWISSGPPRSGGRSKNSLLGTHCVGNLCGSTGDIETSTGVTGILTFFVIVLSTLLEMSSVFCTLGSKEMESWLERHTA